jgi:uncharacterized protein (DUF342 family)
MKEEGNSLRKLEILTSSNNMEVYINIKYIPELTSNIQNGYTPSSLPVYIPEQIRKQLKNNNIVYGIIEDALIQCTNIKGVEHLLVAKGKEPVDTTEDFLEIKFKTSNLKEFIEDNNGRINFKSIGSVQCVKAGEVLAIKHKGIEGFDGIDVYGRSIKHKPGKKINLKAGKGCSIIDEDTIIALEDGKPSFSQNIFCVHKLHTINSDVDIKTGNIKFDGAVVINGTVREDMVVESGNSIEIGKNVEKSKIIAKGDVTVKENVISSNIVSGGEDTVKIKDLHILMRLKENILKLINVSKQLKRNNTLHNNVSYGEILKLLMEKRFKIIPILCSEITNNNEHMLSLFREKLFKLAPLKIEHPKELFEIIYAIDDNIKENEKLHIVQTNIKFSYCQDSTIESSGNITITGKGAYVSKLIAKDYIIFENLYSIARGGIIKAEKEIRCGIVGSLSGVSTKISVEKNGHIYASKAYENTIFSIGNREYILEVSSREIHAYLDSNRELIVDKLLL